jgi:hypothetical protein
VYHLSRLLLLYHDPQLCNHIDSLKLSFSDFRYGTTSQVTNQCCGSGSSGRIRSFWLWWIRIRTRNNHSGYKYRSGKNGRTKKFSQI